MQQAPGRNAGDLTYAVHIGSSAAANSGHHSCEPGVFSSALSINADNNQFIVAANVSLRNHGNVSRVGNDLDGSGGDDAGYSSCGLLIGPTSHQ